jgi:hypothetical protein
MGVGIKVGSIVDEIGDMEFLYAFFSTLNVRLEPWGWGTRFPILLQQLYQGHVTATDAAEALTELQQARAELAKWPASAVVWSAEDRDLQPPWGDDISPDITDLSNYFVNSTGRDLFELLLEALKAAVESGEPAEIVSY